MNKYVKKLLIIILMKMKPCINEEVIIMIMIKKMKLYYDNIMYEWEK